MRIRWTTRAAEQLLASVDYLETEREGSGLALHDAVRRTIDVVLDHPRVFPAIPDAPGGEARRALIRPWQYWLIFEVRELDATIVVLALWNARRRPEGWRDE